MIVYFSQLLQQQTVHMVKLLVFPLGLWSFSYLAVFPIRICFVLDPNNELHFELIAFSCWFLWIKHNIWIYAVVNNILLFYSNIDHNSVAVLCTRLLCLLSVVMLTFSCWSIAYVIVILFIVGWFGQNKLWHMNVVVYLLCVTWITVSTGWQFFCLFLYHIIPQFDSICTFRILRVIAGNGFLFVRENSITWWWRKW